ncbi:MAG TPA: N,N-dimethylformamidase beta subunit family domain-containing protein, partial [Acetobacteraceae bacterium]|nr:N,N-dimethylformamidase beta subunit family domain-containing protein [Acetobacteraceae bacterium]
MSTHEPPIIGYLDRFSHRPGESFTVFVSMSSPSEYRARLVRVLSGDPNPHGPGVRFDDLSDRFNGAFAGRRQAVHRGSYAIVDRGPTHARDAARTWTVLVRAGITGEEQALLAQEAEDVSVVLLIGAEGASARITSAAARVAVATGTPIAPARWYRVWLAADPASGRVVVGQQLLDGAAPAIASVQAHGIRLPSSGRIMMAAENAAAPSQHFTGKLEDPAILNGFVASWGDPGISLQTLAPELLAGWDFSRGIDTQIITDIGPQACAGRLVNTPTRAMVGTRWSGTEQCWRHAPRDYGAIHFHDDDLSDCNWQPDFTWTVPDDLRSGAYALHLTCEGGEDWLPLYVLPKRQGPFAPIVFLASTFTYQAYANHERSSVDEGYFERVAAWGAYPNNPNTLHIYGHSTYNKHRDGSGIAFSTRRRPILTMRPGFLTFNDPRGSGMRHYPADLHLLAWLEAKGFDFDIVTDEDLDEEGVTLIAPYRTLLTGSHPEYHTTGTLDALSAYTNQGGRLCYLGGNGFYWRITRQRATPYLIELRRAEGGIRTWAAEPGEYYHQTDGQLGGLWRRNRRPPQMLVGVGFSCQAAFEGTY